MRAMTTLLFSVLVWLASFAAGFLGALTGLGGGVVIVPLLVLVFNVDIHYAAGASLVSVIATSSGAAAAYVKEGYSNIRVGMFLEIATTFGAICGAYLTGVVSASAVAIIFGLVLLWSGVMSFRKTTESTETNAPDKIAQKLRLDGEFPTPQGKQAYHVQHVPLGFGLMYMAGLLSGLLGIGSGAVKVLAMDRAMRLPFKVSTTTSNFMIGVTAAASAGIYLHKGFVAPGLVMPVMLGVLPGALVGAKVLSAAKVPALRFVFGLVIVALAVQMIYDGLRGSL